MASATWWTWVCVNSWSLWWTGRPGMLHFMGSQRVGHDWATELNWTESSLEFPSFHFFIKKGREMENYLSSDNCIYLNEIGWIKLSWLQRSYLTQVPVVWGGQRSLMWCSPRAHKESDKRLSDWTTNGTGNFPFNASESPHATDTWKEA